MILTLDEYDRNNLPMKKIGSIATTILTLAALILLFFTLLSSNSIAATKNKNDVKSLWKVDRTNNEMSGSKDISISLKSIKPINGQFGQVVPSMHFVCKENNFNIYINTFFILESDYEGDTSSRIKLDENEPTKIWGSISTDHEAIFVRYPDTFLGDLLVSRLVSPVH